MKSIKERKKKKLMMSARYLVDVKALLQISEYRSKTVSYINLNNSIHVSRCAVITILYLVCPINYIGCLNKSALMNYMWCFCAIGNSYFCSCHILYMGV